MAARGLPTSPERGDVVGLPVGAGEARAASHRPRETAGADGAHLNRLYGTLLREGGRDGGLSPRSVQYVHAILRKALDDAVAWGVLARNPADRATAPTQTAVNRARIEMQTWSPAELRIFLEHVERDRLYAGWLLTATTGMRRGEVLGL